MKKALCLILCMLSMLFIVSCNDDDDTTQITLGTPTLSMNDGSTACWTSIDGAVGYEYRINDGEAVLVDASVLKLKLLPGETIVVRAIGDGEKYLTGEWSQSIKSNSLVTLKKPNIRTTAIGNQLLVSWDAVENASGYVYRLNNGEENYTSSTSFLINASDSFMVRAQGNDTTYLDSAWAIIQP